MYLMRQIETDIKPEWDKVKMSPKNTALIEDCEPNMLIGWTDKNPSIWDVTADSNKPTLENILVALCRRKKSWEKIAYIKFKKSAVDNAKLRLTKTNGNTSDTRIDISGTHFEIQGITAKQLCTLIYYTTKDEFETGIFKKSHFDKILLEAYDNTLISELQKSSTSPNYLTVVAETSTTKNKEQDHANVGIDLSTKQVKSIASSDTEQN
jgi:hypothetical protein